MEPACAPAGEDVGPVKARCARVLADPRAWWRHPVARLVVTWVITAQDFFIYAEDPSNDSHVMANFPGLGNILGLLAVHAAPTGALALLRVVLVVAAGVLGILVGRLFLVQVLRKRWNISAFQGPEGALCMVSVATAASLLLGSFVYNAIVPLWAEPISGASLELLQLLGARSLEYRHVNQCFQALSGAVDLLAMMMILDTVLQDRHYHPTWAPRMKRLWTGMDGWVRVLVYWPVLLVGTVTCAVLVFKTGQEPGDIKWNNTTLGGTSEVTRSLVAAGIICTDLLTVAQDWDFPAYEEPLDVAFVPLIGGTFMTRLRFDCLGDFVKHLTVEKVLPTALLARLPSPDFFRISISGKWFTYAPLMLVMVIDLLCAKTQMGYDPVDFGQYVDPVDHRIWVIMDGAYLARAYDRGVLVNASMITYAARRNTTTGAPLTASAQSDVKVNSRYVGAGAGKLCGLPIALAAVAAFLVVFVVADRLHSASKTDASAAEASTGTLMQDAEMEVGVKDLETAATPASKPACDQRGDGVAAAADTPRWHWRCPCVWQVLLRHAAV